MEVRVTKYLNVRVGRPSVNAPCYQYLAPGSILTVDDKIIDGDFFEGSNKWLKDAAGNYYWAGAVEKTERVSLLWTYNPDKMSWMYSSEAQGGYGIVDLWNKMGVRGKGVNVLVLDTGISSDSNFNLKGSKFRTPFTSKNDTDGHGTNCASALCANGNVVYGVAPEVNLFVVRFTANQYGSIESFIQGLNLVERGWNIDVVSISYAFKQDDSKIQDAIRAKFSKDTWIFSSLNHNNVTGLITDNAQYPACYSNVIPVAAFDQGKNVVQPCQFMNKTEKINLAFPGDNVKVLSKSGGIELAGHTSIATPIAAGIFSLFLSYYREKDISISESIRTNIFNAIVDTGTKRKVNDHSEILICNPLQAFNRLTNIGI